MRIRITLDDDVVAAVEAEAQRLGRSFEETVNESLRRDLAPRREEAPLVPFKVAARDLGDLLPGLSLDSIPDLVERVEDPPSR
jgi:plasmid stability protein